MCSVCGIATLEAPKDPNTTRRAAIEMLDRTRHRGPDGCGLFSDGRVVFAPAPEDLLEAAGPPEGACRVVLAQSRLAITGTPDARQPFTSADGGLALAHNGEIYNHVELAGLLGDGSLTTRSDSEVLLRVLEHHHAATAGDLAAAMQRTVAVADGMYAIAATDGKDVVLARDAIGKKPLYYVAGPGAFAWASERKALVPVARHEDAPIRRLPAGRLLACREDLSVEVRVVERMAPPAVDILEAETADREYAAALERAIERRTRGLQRAAVLFSGGVDSVLVARMLQRRGMEVTGYVSGLAGSNDIREAVAVAKLMELPVRVTPVDEETFDEWLPRIMEHTELHGPLMTEVSVPMWFAAKAAHEDGHRVIFTGQAADELFAGYPWYGKVLAEHGPLTLHARMWEDLHALPLDTLEREDRITMAWALEMRAPFLDPDVIRTAFRIAPHLKITGAKDPQRKHPHRRVAEAMGVPKSAAWRKKEAAQDGASMRDLLEAAAKRRFPDGAPVAGAEVPDFGSNYRYRDTMGAYASREVYAMLADTAAQGGFVVADAKGEAVAPPLPNRSGVATRAAARSAEA